MIESAAGLQLSVPTLSARSDGEPLQILMLLTSPNLFELLGVAPMLGRGFAANEVGPNRPSVIVLSHALWTRLGGDPSIIGAQVWLSGSPYTVIGVMGPNFRFVRHSTLGPPQEPDVYLPFGFQSRRSGRAEPKPGNVCRAGSDSRGHVFRTGRGGGRRRHACGERSQPSGDAGEALSDSAEGRSRCPCSPDPV